MNLWSKITGKITKAQQIEILEDMLHQKRACIEGLDKEVELLRHEKAVVDEREAKLLVRVDQLDTENARLNRIIYSVASAVKSL